MVFVTFSQPNRDTFTDQCAFKLQKWLQRDICYIWSYIHFLMFYVRFYNNLTQWKWRCRGVHMHVERRVTLAFQKSLLLLQSEMTLSGFCRLERISWNLLTALKPGSVVFII